MLSLQLHQYESINDFQKENWNFVAQDNTCIQYNYLKAIEKSQVNNLKPYYIITSQNNQPIGIVYFGILDFDLTGIITDYSNQSIKTVREWYPDFMNSRLLECGHISGIGETIISRNGNFSNVLETSIEKIENIANKNNVDIIVIRDIPHEKFDLYNKILSKKNYLAVIGFPTAKLEICWNSFDEYLEAVKSKTRLNIHQHLNKLNDKAISIEQIQDFGKYSERLQYLWEITEERATEYKHEKLTSSYFKEINYCLKDQSHILAIKHNNKIIAFGLVILGKDEYFAAYTGFDKEYNKQYDLYFNMYFITIKDAIKKRKKWLNFGITSYSFKLFIGAELEHKIYFIKHMNDPNFTAALANTLNTSINKPINNHRPFKDQDTSERIQSADILKMIEFSGKSKQKDIFQKAYRYMRTTNLKMADLYSFFPVFEYNQKPVIHNLGKPIIMLGSNSYLGLGSHPNIIEAAKSAIDIYGTGCTGSPILNGTLDVHAELTDKLTQYFQKDGAILFSTGYMTNLGVISAIAGRHDVVITDSLDHASIIDGCQFCRASAVRFKHNDLMDLEKKLQKYEDKAKLVIVDSVFSMEGTIADLPSIVKLCKKYHSRIMVDEAHGVGVLGDGGRGAVELFGLINKVDIIMSTFSKSFAAIGGFVVSENRVIEYIRHVSRPHMFSASLPPSVITTVRKALQIIINEPERRRKLHENAKFMARELQNLGYEAPYCGTAIVPVYCRDELITLSLFKKLFEEGVYVNPVLSPAVKKGDELLRTSYMATHDEEDLLRALEVFKKVRTPYFP